MWMCINHKVGKIFITKSRRGHNVLCFQDKNGNEYYGSASRELYTALCESKDKELVKQLIFLIEHFYKFPYRQQAMDDLNLVAERVF